MATIFEDFHKFFGRVRSKLGMDHFENDTLVPTFCGGYHTGSEVIEAGGEGRIPLFPRMTVKDSVVGGIAIIVEENSLPDGTSLEFKSGDRETDLKLDIPGGESGKFSFPDKRTFLFKFDDLEIKYDSSKSAEGAAKIHIITLVV